MRKAHPAGNGTHTYKFRYAIPADASGSGAISIQGFRLLDLKKPNGDVIKGQRDVGLKSCQYFAITDRDAVPRRQAVKIENCNVCHVKLQRPMAKRGAIPRVLRHVPQRSAN